MRNAGRRVPRLPAALGDNLPRLAAYWLAFALLALAAWIGHTFGEPDIEQVTFHLRYSESAAVRMTGIFAFTFVAEVLAFPLAFAAVAAFVHARLLAHPMTGVRHALRAAPPVVALAGVFALMLKFSAFSYAAAHFEPDRFAARYADPVATVVKPGRLRNLVLVYAESLEDSYGDAALFGRDLLAPLRSLGGESFPHYQPRPGSTWTIAAMVATQCGVPLTVYSESDTRRTGDERVFLPGATCLGDLLRAHGFRNVFLGGAPLSFAGKGSFLRDHGYHEAWGLDEWERQGLRPGEQNEWGLYDAALLRRARAKLEELHASGQPFNLTLLTLDTHNPHGFLSPECRARGARDFAGIVACGSAQLAEFVQFARARGYLRDTVIVVMGDHLAVPNPVSDRLERAPRRGIYNLLLAPPDVRRNAEAVDPFDFFPTLVELAGLDVQGDRLGLGYSAVGAAEVQRPGPRDAIPLASLHGSATYRALWTQPED